MSCSGRKSGKKEMWMVRRSTGDDNYDVRWTAQRSDRSLLIGVIAGQFITNIDPQLFGVNGFHDVCSPILSWWIRLRDTK